MSCILTYNRGDIIYVKELKQTFVCMVIEETYGKFHLYNFGLITGGPFISSPIYPEIVIIYFHYEKAYKMPIIGNVCIDCGFTPYWNMASIKVLYPELYLKILTQELAQRNVTWGLPEDGFKNEPGQDLMTEEEINTLLNPASSTSPRNPDEL